MNDLPPPLEPCLWFMIAFMGVLLLCMVANPLMDLGKGIYALFKKTGRKKKVQ
jgi:hypothetical protein